MNKYMYYVSEYIFEVLNKLCMYILNYYSVIYLCINK